MPNKLELPSIDEQILELKSHLLPLLNEVAGVMNKATELDVSISFEVQRGPKGHFEPINVVLTRKY
jgi:hypothetical protein